MKRHFKKTFIAGLALITLVSSGIFAYLIATSSTKTNTFGFANGITVTITEPKWDALTDTDGDDIPDVAENLIPGTSITKDPTATLSGDVDSYIYIQVKVPIAKNAVLVDSNGNKQTAANTELFSYTINSGWTQVDKTTHTFASSDAAYTIGYNTYVYAYNTVVSPGDAGVVLFNTVTFKDFADTSKFTTAKIDVNAAAIQAEGFTSATAAYAAYENQNS